MDQKTTVITDSKKGDVVVNIKINQQALNSLTT
jgi:hypothetical protein